MLVSSTIRLISFSIKKCINIVNVNHYTLKKGQVIMSNNVFSEQSNLVYRHFLCCVAYLFLYFVVLFLLLCLM